MTVFGPTFGDELLAALGPVAIAFSPDTGEISGRETLTADQAALLDRVIAAHDPARRRPRSAKRKELLRAADDLGKLLALNSAAAATTKRKDQIAWLAEDIFLESNPSLGRLCATAGLEVKTLFDRVEANAAG